MSEIHYTVDGPADAPVVVLGSSLGMSGEMWRPQVAALSARFRLVRYDHRGHGGSMVPDEPYRMDELGGDVLVLLDALGLDRVHLGGLSLGGMVAMWVAAHAPERVDRLALLCTSAGFGQPAAWAERAAAVRAGGTVAVADFLIGRWFTPAFAARQPDVVAWARRQLLDTPAAGYAACCGAIEVMDLEPVLGDITAPTLVIAGDDDPATPPVHAKRIAAGIPGAQLEVLPGAAHLASVEQPDAVNRLLLDFFGGIR